MSMGDHQNMTANSRLRPCGLKSVGDIVVAGSVGGSLLLNQEVGGTR
jgi:hypothetical protein